DTVIERVEKGDFSSGAWEQVLKLIEARDLTQSVSGPKIESSAFVGLMGAIEETRQIRLRLFAAAVDACDDLLRRKHDLTASNQSDCLSVLYETLQVGENPITELPALNDERYSAALTEVVRSAIVAAALNPDQLKAEAQAAIERLSEADASLSELSSANGFS